jgi:hypothetical protein
MLVLCWRVVGVRREDCADLVVGSIFVVVWAGAEIGPLWVEVCSARRVVA